MTLFIFDHRDCSRCLGIKINCLRFAAAHFRVDRKTESELIKERREEKDQRSQRSLLTDQEACPANPLKIDFKFDGCVVGRKRNNGAI